MTAVALKLMPAIEAPETDTDAVEGENAYPERLGASTYDPFERPVNTNFPPPSVVVVAPLVPDSVTVAADPLTLPEIVYVVGGVTDAAKFTADTEAPATVTDVTPGENV